MEQRKVTQVLFKVPPWLRDAFAMAARAHGMSMASAMRALMRRYVTESEERLQALLAEAKESGKNE